jgi:hypothetical protein
MKICFTSALFCEKENLDQLDKPGHFDRNKNYDYFLFTNLEPHLFDTSWDVINIGENENISNVNCNIKKSRYPKFLSWHLLESLGKKYDVVFYCDAWVVPNEKKDWKSLATKIKNEKTFPFAQPHHNRKVCRDGGVNAEFERILISKRDTPESIQKTKRILKTYDFSVNLDYPQYYENTCFGYKFSSDVVRNITHELWTLYLKKDVSYRDQPLWNFLLLKNKVNPIMQNDLKDNSFRDTDTFRKLNLNGYKATDYLNEHCWFIRKYENEGTMRDGYAKRFDFDK